MANLLSCDRSAAKIYKHTGISSTITTSFASPSSYPAGLAYDGWWGVVLNQAPTAPTSLLCEGATNPINVVDTTPEFSAIYNDPDSGDIANKYRIQVDDDPAFGSPIWDSGAAGTAMGNVTAGSRCADISYAGSALSTLTTYYWRIKFWDDGGAEGAWSTESAYFDLTFIKTVNGLANASIKTINGLAIASVKKFDGLA